MFMRWMMKKLAADIEAVVPSKHNDPTYLTDQLIKTLERMIEEKDEVIEFLRVELAASREREGWYQQRFVEERDAANRAADTLIMQHGREPITSVGEKMLRARANAEKKVEEAEDDPFLTLPFGHPDGMYKTAEEAQDIYAGEE